MTEDSILYLAVVVALVTRTSVVLTSSCKWIVESAWKMSALTGDKLEEARESAQKASLAGVVVSWPIGVALNAFVQMLQSYGTSLTRAAIAGALTVAVVAALLLAGLLLYCVRSYVLEYARHAYMAVIVTLILAVLDSLLLELRIGQSLGRMFLGF